MQESSNGIRMLLRPAYLPLSARNIDFHFGREAVYGIISGRHFGRARAHVRVSSRAPGQEYLIRSIAYVRCYLRRVRAVNSRPLPAPAPAVACTVSIFTTQHPARRAALECLSIGFLSVRVPPLMRRRGLELGRGVESLR